MRKLAKWAGIGLGLFCAGLLVVIGYGAMQFKRATRDELLADLPGE